MLLKKDPSERITAAEALKHPFFEEVTPIEQKVDPADVVTASTLKKQHQLVPTNNNMDTDLSQTKSAMQAKGIIERVCGLAMNTLWKLWITVHP